MRKLSWPGIPDELRPQVWKLLFEYLPANLDRRQATLERKRNEYKDYVGQMKFPIQNQLSHQIHIDIMRTNADTKLYQNEKVRESLERVLYVWAIRHPASGYVQGINDLITPFFQVFLCEHQQLTHDFQYEQLSQEIVSMIEADTFWCLSKLLDGIQDSYTHGQPGILRQVTQLEDLVARIDGTIVNSSISSAFQATKCRVYSIRMEMDELLINARIINQQHYTDVGLLLCTIIN